MQEQDSPNPVMDARRGKHDSRDTINPRMNYRFGSPEEQGGRSNTIETGDDTPLAIGGDETGDATPLAIGGGDTLVVAGQGATRGPGEHVPGGQRGRPDLPGVAVIRAFKPGIVEPTIDGIPGDMNQGGRPELTDVAVKRAFKTGFVEPRTGGVPGVSAQGSTFPADRPDDTAKRKCELGLHGQGGRPEPDVLQDDASAWRKPAGRRVGGDNWLRAGWRAGRAEQATCRRTCTSTRGSI